MTRESQENTVMLHANALDRNSSEPMYHQLFILLRDKILSGQLKAGDLLPPESELVEMYKISRITVRQAVDRLAAENLVSKQRGKGTFVLKPEIRSDATTLIEFEKEMRQRGHVPTAQVLHRRIVTVSRVTAEKLQMNDGDDLTHISRLWYVDEQPMTVEDIFLVTSYCPDILTKHDFSRESIYDIWENRYGVRIERAEQTVSAMMPPKEIGDLLQLKGQPLLYIERISFSQLNIPVEMRHIYYRADRYSLQMNLVK